MTAPVEFDSDELRDAELLDALLIAIHDGNPARRNELLQDADVRRT
jgi:hypothetical protein